MEDLTRVAPVPIAVEPDAVGQQCLVLDGLVDRRLWRGRTARDLPVDAGTRARCLRHLLGHDGVVGHRAAAWVHCGGPPPEVVDVIRPRPVRSRHGTVRPRVAALPEGHVVRIGGVAVTTLPRTACDVARFSPAEAARDTLSRLLEHGLDPRAAQACLAGSRGRVNTLGAQALLEEVLGPAAPAPQIT